MATRLVVAGAAPRMAVVGPTSRVDITVDSIKVDGETATAHVVLTFDERDEPDDVKRHFVREDGAWKRCLS